MERSIYGRILAVKWGKGCNKALSARPKGKAHRVQTLAQQRDTALIEGDTLRAEKISLLLKQQEEKKIYLFRLHATNLVLEEQQRIERELQVIARQRNMILRKSKKPTRGTIGQYLASNLTDKTQ